jgi:N-acylneuraminate cytidylyltransferase
MVPLMEGDLFEPFNMPRQKLPQTYWQTGHIDVIRYETIIRKRSLTGQNVIPIIIDREYCIDIDRPLDLKLAKWAIEQSLVEIDNPKSDRKSKKGGNFPERFDLLVFDFDGVFTDNRVWVTEQGKESVACHRADGMGLALLKAKGIEAIVLSTEKNPVVSARCKKLGINCLQSLDDKVPALMLISRERGIDLKNITYVGNDINDLGCMKLAGFTVSVADAHPKVLDQADLVLKSRGGHGAVRELCDKILSSKEQRDAESS